MTKICSAEGCERQSVCRGYCDKHYRRWKKHGDPSVDHRKGKPFLERIAARIERRGDCLVWTGATTPQGYGHIRVDGKVRGVHRIYWEAINGPIPDGKVVDHICWNKACVNINHLRLITHAQNLQYRPGPPINSTTGVRNVFKQGGKYRVSLKVDGMTTNFGLYETLEEAEVAAEQVRDELFGQYAGRGRAA